MLKFKFYLIFTVFSFTSLFSQSFVSKIFDYQGRTDAGLHILQSNDKILFSSTVTNDSMVSATRLTEIDLSGEVIWETVFDSLLIGHSHNLFSYGEDGYLLCTDDLFNSEGNNIKFLFLDAEGNIIEEMNYGENWMEERSSGLFELSDSYLLILSVPSETNDGNHPVLVKMNENLETIWETELEDNLYENYNLRWAKEDSQGNIYATGREGAFHNYSVMIKINAEGEQLWRYSHPTYNRLHGGLGMLLDDDGIYLTGARDFTVPSDGESFVFPNYIIKLSTEGEFLWEKNLWFPWDRLISNFSFRRDDEIIFHGAADGGETDLVGGSWIASYNTDFDLNWERIIIDRRYKYIGRSSIYSVTEYDSQLICLGKQPALSQIQAGVVQSDTYLLITDSLGCLEPGCGFIQIIDEDGNYSTITATEDIQSNADNPLSVKVFPNPVSEVLSVKLLGEQPELTGLELIDAAGRVVKNYPLPVGNAFTLTVPPVASGIYFLRGHTGAGVWTKKITVR